MSKDDFIQHLIKGMGSDYFGRGRLRKLDPLQWTQVCTVEMRRLSELSYGELEMLYRKSEGLCEIAE